MNEDCSPNLTMPDDLGRRLRAVRRERHISQAEAAAVADLARTTLISIEKGQREVRVRELHLLAGKYGVSTDDLFRPKAVFVDIIPRCRALGLFVDPAVKDAVLMVAGLAAAEAELEAVLGLLHATNYPMERPLLRGDVRLQAEQDARDVRDWLGFEAATLPDMTTLLPGELGLRVFERPLAAHVRGLYVLDEAVGACAIVNAALSTEAKRFTAAFQLACLVSARQDVGVLLEQPGTRTRAFRYADAFARAFLMPARAVMQQFKTIARPGLGLTWQHIVALSAVFAVPHKTLVRRLEDLKLVLPCSWVRFEAEAECEPDKRALPDPQSGETNVAAPPACERVYQLAAQAWRRDLMTEAQLAGLLHLDRPAVRPILTAATQHDMAEATLDVVT